MARPRIKITEPQEAIRLISEGLSVRKACKQAGITVQAFYNRMNAEPSLLEHYARAMQCRADALFDEIVDIADNNEPGADTNRDRLRVDTRKWIVAKMMPKKYGDRPQELIDPEQDKLTIEIVDRRKESIA